MELLASNGWAQLLLLISTGILCLAMSVWLAVQRFRLPKRIPVVAAGANMSNLHVEPHAPTLHITSVVQHGRIIEIKGATGAGAVVMINGQPVASIFPENAFRHILGPLPAGTTIITVTC
jgi:hypothetical protein